MYKIFITLAAVFSVSFAQAQFSSARLTAAGLTCSMCTRAIYNSLEKLPAVKKVDTDIRQSAFLIDFKESAMVDPDDLRTAVENAGFSVASLFLTAELDNTVIGEDAHVNINGKTFHFLKAKPGRLSGKQELKMADRNFVPAKEFRKLSAASDHACVETGRTEQCCVKTGASSNGRVYHVTL